jgi:hypothetical protein
MKIRSQGSPAAFVARASPEEGWENVKTNLPDGDGIAGIGGGSDN